MKRMLIVSPGFHGYYSSISRAFESLGYDVDTYCYDVAGSKAEQVWRKLRHELPAKLTHSDAHLSADQVSRAAAARVREVKPDITLVIRGDVFTAEFWSAAGDNSGQVAVWMYDEIRRTAFDPSLVGHYARMATYSNLDTAELVEQGFDALHVPLGFDDTLPISDGEMGAGVISFIGAPFAKRENALRALMSSGLPVHAWGRGWSSHPYDRARTWRMKDRGIPAGRDVPGSFALEIMRNSVATLNIHGDQDGFTMRTFEASGIGALQFIDRVDVSEFYEPGREILVFESDEELVSLAREALASPARFNTIRENAVRRTLAEHTLTHRARSLEDLWK